MTMDDLARYCRYAVVLFFFFALYAAFTFAFTKIIVFAVLSFFFYGLNILITSGKKLF